MAAAAAATGTVSEAARMSLTLRVLAVIPISGLAGVSALSSSSFPDISSLLVLTVPEVPPAASIFFEDDIEDPVSSGLSELESLLGVEEPALEPPLENEAGDSLPYVPVPVEAEEASASVAAVVERGTSEEGGPVTGSQFNPSAAVLAKEALSEDERTPSETRAYSPDNAHSQRRTADPRVTNCQKPGNCTKKRMPVMGFMDAKKAFNTGIRGPGVPWTYRLYAGRVVQSIRQPKDATHAAYIAALMQLGSYGLRCVGEFRRLRHIDKGRTKTTLQEVQNLKQKIPACFLPIKTFLGEATARLGGPLRKKGPRGGWDRAAALLDALSSSLAATEQNFSALTAYLEAKLTPKTPSNVLQSLKEERQRAKAEFEAAKAITRAEARAVEDKGLIPRAFPLL